MKDQVTLSAIRKIVRKETSKIVENVEVEKTIKFATKEDLKALATRDDLIKFKDEILDEIEKLREENAILGSHGNRLEDQENRITTLEKSSSVHTT